MSRKLFVRCEFGRRWFTEHFTDEAKAAGFVRAVLGKEAFKIVNERSLTARGGTLTIFCHQLDELLNIEDTTAPPDEINSKIKQFFSGKWTTLLPEGQAKAKLPAKVNGHSVVVTLSDICVRHKWKPRIVRAALREAKIKKPASGSWSWPSNEAKKIETRIEGLMK